MQYLSERSEKIPASPIRKLLPLELETKKRGTKIYKLNIGQPDIETPDVFYKAIRSDLPAVLAYGPSQGLPELRNEISNYYKKINIPFESDEIFVTSGGSEALYFAFMAIADPGDEIIVFEPFYTNYIGFGIYSGVKLVPYATKAENGFHLPSKTEIEALITPKTRAILICSPNNPTGTVLTKNELELLADIALERDLFIISDEVYREFAYEEKAESIMSIERIHDRVILTDSISKRFSACGARIGNLATKNKDVYNAVLRYGQARLCPPTTEQIGAVELYKLDAEYYKSVRMEYQKRRDVIFDEISKIPGVVCQKPKGAFYIMVKLPIDDGDKFAKWLLTDFSDNNETVMVAPGAGFYSTEGVGTQEIRLAYVLKSEDCKRAAELLRLAVEEYSSKMM